MCWSPDRVDLGQRHADRGHPIEGLVAVAHARTSTGTPIGSIPASLVIPALLIRMQPLLTSLPEAAGVAGAVDAELPVAAGEVVEHLGVARTSP